MKTTSTTFTSIPGSPKTLALGIMAIVAALALSGCSALGIESKYDKRTSHDFTTGAEGKEKGTLPLWVPDEASDIKEMVRTTGNERILRLNYSGALPETCTKITVAGKPSVNELTAGLNHEEPRDAKGLAAVVQQQYQIPLLSADWWPTGQESRATHLCGKWWVSTVAEKVYAFAPEEKSIAEHVLTEQANIQQAEK